MSYLGRNDLAHVEPADLRTDTLGRGDQESAMSGASDEDDALQMALDFRFFGLPAWRQERDEEPTRCRDRRQEGRFDRRHGWRLKPPLSRHSMTMRLAQRLSRSRPPEAPVQLAAGDSERFSMGGGAVDAADDKMRNMEEARMKGYTGDACDSCGNFTLVRNGTCLKCVTCGSTTGCSLTRSFEIDPYHEKGE